MPERKYLPIRSIDEGNETTGGADTNTSATYETNPQQRSNGDDELADDTGSDASDESDGLRDPGIVGSITSLGGVSYLLKRRLGTDDEVDN